MWSEVSIRIPTSPRTLSSVSGWPAHRSSCVDAALRPRIAAPAIPQPRKALLGGVGILIELMFLLKNKKIVNKNKRMRIWKKELSVWEYSLKTIGFLSIFYFIEKMKWITKQALVLLLHKYMSLIISKLVLFYFMKTYNFVDKNKFKK